MTSLIDAETLISPELAEQARPPCEWFTNIRDREACEAAADWIVRVACGCGKTDMYLMCDDHYQAIFQPAPTVRASQI